MTNVKDPNQDTPQEADIQERIDGFNKELLPLLGKYELGLAAMPKILKDGRIAADPILVSVRQMRKNEAEAEQKQTQPNAAPAVGGLDNPDA